MTIVTKLLAVIVQSKKAEYFGRESAVVDCFEWAIFYPTLVYSFAVNVLNALLVPIFAGRKASRSLDRAYHALVSWSVVGFLVVGVLIALLAAPLAEWNFAHPNPRAPDTVVDPNRAHLATVFLWILAGTTLFIGIEGVQTGFLLAEKRVASVALVRLLKEIVLVAVVVFGFACLGDRLLPGAWLAATAVGGVVFFLLGFRRHRFSFRFGHMDKYILRLLRNLWPVLILFVLINLNELIRLKLLSAQLGDLTTFRYAYYIFLLPTVLITENLILFLFPMMAAEINQGDVDRLRHSIRSGVKLIAFFIFPASVGLIVLAQPIVRLIYERQAFTAADTSATVLPLIWLSVGMWAFSIHVLFARTLDAMQAYWRRIALEAPFVLVSVLLSLWLIPMYGPAGGAIALSASFVFLLGLEVWQISRRIESIRMVIIAGDLLKIAAATAVMGAGVWLVYPVTRRLIASDGLKAQLAQLGASVVIGVVIYFACSLVLRIVRAGDLADLRNYLLFRRNAAVLPSDGGAMKGESDD